MPFKEPIGLSDGAELGIRWMCDDVGHDLVEQRDCIGDDLKAVVGLEVPHCVVDAPLAVTYNVATQMLAGKQTKTRDAFNVLMASVATSSPMVFLCTPVC